MKQKQKQSVVIKNVININERKPKPMNRRQKRARKQPVRDGRVPTGGGAVSGGNTYLGPGAAGQYPMSRLFQVQSNEPRSLTMSSANANETSINVSKVANEVQSIVYGKIKNDLNDALTFQAFRRLQESEISRPSGVRVDEVVDEGEVDFEREINKSNDEYKKLLEQKKKLEDEMKDVIVEDVGEDKQDFLSDTQKEQERILGKAQANIEKKKRISKKERERMKQEEEETLKELEKAYDEIP